MIVPLFLFFLASINARSDELLLEGPGPPPYYHRHELLAYQAHFNSMPYPELRKQCVFAWNTGAKLPLECDPNVSLPLPTATPIPTTRTTPCQQMSPSCYRVKDKKKKKIRNATTPPDSELANAEVSPPAIHSMMWMGIGAASVVGICGIILGYRRWKRIPPPPTMTPPLPPWESNHYEMYATAEIQANSKYIDTTHLQSPSMVLLLFLFLFLLLPLYIRSDEWSRAYEEFKLKLKELHEDKGSDMGTVVIAPNLPQLRPITQPTRTSSINSTSELPDQTKDHKVALTEVSTNYYVLWIGIGAVTVVAIIGIYIGCRRMKKTPSPPSMEPPAAPLGSEYNGGYDRIGY